MRIKILFFLIGAALWSAQAQGLKNSVLHSGILEGVDLTLRQEYGRADSVFQKMIEEFPDHPAGYLYKVAVVQSRAMDHKLEMAEIDFDSLLTIGMGKAEQLVEREPSSPWGHFFLGTALGYQSYSRVYREEWFGGITKAMSSVDEFKKALEKDSTLYDACVGIGAYYYWKSRKTEFLHWLPFVSDNREEGIGLIEQTARGGTYNRYTAMSVLASIQLDAGNFKEAERWAQLGWRKYPRNRIFLWEYSAALERQGKYRDAAEVYRELLGVISTNGEKHGYNEMVCRLNLAKTLAALGDSAEALAQLKVIHKFKGEKFPAHLQKRSRDRLSEATTLEQRLANSKASSK